MPVAQPIRAGWFIMATVVGNTCLFVTRWSTGRPCRAGFSVVGHGNGFGIPDDLLTCHRLLSRGRPCQVVHEDRSNITRST